MHRKQLVGITGFGRSGKSVLIEHMVHAYGFVPLSVSSIVTRELETETGCKGFSREEQRAKGTALKRRLGPDFLVQQALKEPNDRVVIDGLRNLAAARSLLAVGGSIIGLVANPDIRFYREQTADDGKPPHATIAEMARDERPEMNALDVHGTQILPILWSIPPENIIDTSYLTTQEVCSVADNILQLT